MVRAPCCDQMGLKKGPWTPEEDEVLVSFIQRYGHGNWRALPKLAGLMRCGKSCRLRWMNYLRPDIKRGNFSKEEEEAIISLHEQLGNRWSAIAARLPGRTDNEIKNVWHTHLKKRASPSSGQSRKARSCGAAVAVAVAVACTAHGATNSPQPSGSELSSLATDSAEGDRYTESDDGKLFVEMDESFWQEALSTLDSSVATTTSSAGLPEAGCLPLNHAVDSCFRASSTSSDEDDMDFWHSFLMGIGELPELPSSTTSASSNYMLL